MKKEDLKRGWVYTTPFMLLKYRAHIDGHYRFDRLDTKGTLSLSEQTLVYFMKQKKFLPADADLVAKVLLAGK
jgi:hypothetical protein